MTEPSAILDGLWYLACPSAHIKPGRMVRRILFDTPIVFGRTKTGAAFALRDICPHRAAPLSAGRLIDCSTADGGAQVECPYHGWAFSTQTGACMNVPALSENDAAYAGPGQTENAAASMGVTTYSLHEASGLIWIYHDSGADGAGTHRTGNPRIAPPALPVAADARPKITTLVEAAGPFDEAVLGLVDPAHTPIVHKQWWWRDGAPRREKTKNFEPTALGFRMPPHAPSSNSRIYKFLGGAPQTEIEFRLPGLRLETITNNSDRLLGLTAMTPTSAGRTQITHLIYWTMPWLMLFQPILSRMSDSFLAQDGSILTRQNQNLSRAPHRPLYLGDPDTPAKWYFQLKRAWAEQDRSDGFKNPVAPSVLHWRT